MENTNKSGKSLPEKKFSTGAVSATVWKNNGTSQRTGEPVEYRTVNLQRRYKDKNGEWQTANSLRINDLPKAVLVLNKAYEHLVLREQESPDSGVMAGVEEEDIV